MGQKFNLRVHLPDWITSMFPEAIWSLPTGNKVIYLTFDDGPVPEVTPQVLEILRSYNIKACFFMVGENAARYPWLMEQIKKEGHSVGNHTYNHIQGIRSKNSTYLDNIKKADQYIRSNMFRPPHGTLKRGQYRTIVQQYKLVMWDVVSCDYDASITPDDCVKNVIDFVKDGSIITFHDSLKAKKNVLEALPKTIEYLLNEGYRFEKIEFPQKEPHKIVPLQETNGNRKSRIIKLLKGA
ncbi:MAG: polysaccharide deacetylase family protein [Prolixibacteraceae bacterium]|nr:polysaccharide deacetylase family protein [Prolixibacteraceae bacterium]